MKFQVVQPLVRSTVYDRSSSASSKATHCTPLWKDVRISGFRRSISSNSGAVHGGDSHKIDQNRLSNAEIHRNTTKIYKGLEKYVRMHQLVQNRPKLIPRIIGHALRKESISSHLDFVRGKRLRHFHHGNRREINSEQTLNKHEIYLNKQYNQLRTRK